MTQDNNRPQNRTNRRTFLKTVGAGIGGLTVSTAAVSAQEQPEVVRTLRPTTTGHPTLDEVIVKLHDNGSIHVGMGGKLSEPTGPAGYTVLVRNFENGNTPEQASATVQKVQKSELPTQAKPNDEGTTDSGTAHGSASRSGTDGSIGTMDHNGGDSQNDYEGGCWIRSEDPPDLDLCKTDHWTTWTTSGGEVDSVEWRYKWTTWEYTTPESDWNLWDIYHDGIDWSGTDANSRVVADYYNDTWSYDYNRTWAYHRTNISCDPDGSMTWWTDHWHEGEDAGWLRVDAGHYTYGNV